MIRSAALAALVLLAPAASVSAFTSPSAFVVVVSRSSTTPMPVRPLSMISDSNDRPLFDPLGLSSSSPSPEQEDRRSSSSSISAVAAAAAAWTATGAAAHAAGPDWGIFEGRIGSLLHPAAMASMFLLSLSTGFLGLQWRRQRELGEEISALKKELMPNLRGYGSVGDALAAEANKEGEELDEAYVEELRAAKADDVEGRIATLVDERKELSGKGLRDKHYNQGAILAFIGTAFAIEGPLNTYARAGKLFPGPHLYAGAGCVVLWAAAAACVPFMSKGNDTARNVHITANAIGTGLFGWQVITGWPILLKVVELTKWP